MTDFGIHFQYPLLLLLLIPAALVVLVPHFRVGKRFRRTRNRILALVLHSVVLVLAILVLSGMYFAYDVPNEQNELIILVDSSFSNSDIQEQKDDFVRAVINDKAGGFRVGVVKFGYDQVYAAQLSSDTSDTYSKYLRSDDPDTSATNIAAALNYTKTLFAHPQSAKILLVSDGLQTDENAVNVIRAIAAEGIRVDTACFTQEKSQNELRLLSITTPDYHITVGDTFQVALSVQSSFNSAALVTLYDNDEEKSETAVTVTAGTQEVLIDHSFTELGLHKISFGISCDLDGLVENNTFCSYVYLQAYDNLLVIEGEEGESTNVVDVLGDRYENITIVNIRDSENLPSTEDEIAQYDQVILVNIANSDMPGGFDELLHTYVHEMGGSMLTTGGNRTETSSENNHLYNRNDMFNTRYQEMLPVQAINYTPPLGVVMIIDRSGSMSGEPLEAAKSGTLSCIEGVLTERDWCGVMSLSNDYEDELPLTPMTQMNKIVSAVNNIEVGGGTMFSNAIDHAGKMLMACSNVERKHIVLVTDAAPGDSYDEYVIPIRNNMRNGITISMVIIGGSMNEELKTAAETDGGGRYYTSSPSDVARTMRADLSVKEIKAISTDPFSLKIGAYNAVVSGLVGTEEDWPQLSGYYGTKLKTGAVAPLVGEFVPIFAQWNYGAGMVGSFMCDVGGDWSRSFFANDYGRTLFNNAVGILLPTEDIRPKDIRLEMTEDNYSTQLSILTQLKENERLRITVTSPEDERGDRPVQSVTMTASDQYTRYTFTNKLQGLHEVEVAKLNSEGGVITMVSTYRAFSYSEEYNTFTDVTEGEELLKKLATSGKGIQISPDAPWEVYDSAVKKLHKEVDPRLVFIIIAIVLFLADIAVRKFKFKWIHELIRDHREKKRGAGRA